ncbi:MAG: hypothetical protein ACW98I_16940 [Candidatus Hodarchaeales archaeon]|jgi:hypothetical protein
MIHKVVDTAINQLFAIFIPAISKNKEILTALIVMSDYANITGGSILEE